MLSIFMSGSSGCKTLSCVILPNIYKLSVPP
jgi:hypothetical protein